MIRIGLLVFIVALFSPSLLTAQERHSSCPADDAIVDVAGWAAQQLRRAQLDSVAPLHSLTIRRASFERKVEGCGTAADLDRSGELQVLPVRSRVLYNSSYPLNVNTGAVWAGVGLSTTIEAGAEFRLGPLRGSLYPLVAWQQNGYFRTRTNLEIPGFSPLIYRGHPGFIDWPQRHGEDAFVTVHPGQSTIWVEGFGAALGISTENMWIGTAQRAPLMMSNSGPGFPHLFLGTSAPARSRIGSFEAQAFWGQLRESDYFDFDPDNDRTFIAGATLTWQPIFLPGLFIGAHRSWLTAWDQPEWSLIHYLTEAYIDVRGNPAGDNALFALFGRWVLPAARFEVYGEWGREDHWGAWVDLLREMDHTQAFVIGLQKLSGSAERPLRVWAELAHLQHSGSARSGRGLPPWYAHGELGQGYTHRGQLLGAWSGPGSNSQIIGVDLIRADWTTGAAIERVRYDADAYYLQWANHYGETGHDASIGLWLRHEQAVGRGLRVAANANIARRQNRHWIYFTGGQPPLMHWDTNVHFDTELRWNPQLRLRRDRGTR
jgi:hypothetical protein